MTYRNADISMDSAMDFSHHHMGQENPRAPTSPTLDDEWFHKVFDWNSYCRSTQPFDSAPSHYPDASSPRDLSKLSNDFPSVFDSLSIDRLGNELFRMKTPFRSDDDGATASEYSGQTPPELVRGGSASSSDHPGSPQQDRAEEYHHRSEIALREVQAQDDEWTYPPVSHKGSPRGYPAHLQVAEEQEQQARRLADKTAGLKRRHSGSSSNKRHRQVVNPVQTADVRKSKACLPCRVTKTRCNESGVCPGCRAAYPDHSHLVCTRATFAMASPILRDLPDVWSERAEEEERLRSEPQFYIGKARDISILFSTDSSLPSMRATVQGYRSYDGSDEIGNLRKADFPRERVPSHDQLQRWVEAHVRNEYSPGFEHSLQSFLMSYAEEGRGLPKHGLVNKVHKMNCFFRIMTTSAFCCRDPANNIASLPLSVQAQLRNIARKAFRSLEHDVFKELDDHLAQQKTPKLEESLAIWASMWQLILMYRSLLGAFEVHLTRLSAFGTDPVTMAKQTRQYQWLCDHFFPLLTVFYHYQFRSKKSLELSLDFLKSSKYPRKAYESKTLRNSTRQLVGSRKDLYKMIQSSEEEVDQLLCIFVVDHEMKKLNARKRTPKASSKRVGDAEEYDREYV